MGKYTVDAYQRLKAAFPNQVENAANVALYAAGIYTNNIIQRAKVQTANQLKGKYRKEGNKPFRQSDAINRGRDAINYTFDELGFDDYYFQLDPLVSVFFEKDLLISKVQGGKPVIEMIGEDLPAITIQGIVWDPDGNYPRKEVKDLIKVFQKNKVLECTSYLMGIYGIKNVYIKSLELPDMEGYMDTQPYRIQCFGYDPPELVIEDV